MKKYFGMLLLFAATSVYGTEKAIVPLDDFLKLFTERVRGGNLIALSPDEKKDDKFAALLNYLKNHTKATVYEHALFAIDGNFNKVDRILLYHYLENQNENNIASLLVNLRFILKDNGNVLIVTKPLTDHVNFMLKGLFPEQSIFTLKSDESDKFIGIFCMPKQEENK